MPQASCGKGEFIEAMKKERAVFAYKICLS